MTQSAKPRPAGGRYPRGEETKQRIVDVAIDMFGRQGFGGASTREIAAAAAVNTPAIHYYFGGKLGLFEACVDHLTQGVWRRIGPAVLACHAAVDAGATLDGLVSALGEVQGCLVDSFFADREGEAIRRLLAWEDAEDGERRSGTLIKERIGVPVFVVFQKVVERLTSGSSLDRQLHAISLLGLSMVFHFNQSKVMDLLERPSMDAALVPALKAVAHKQLTYALRGLSEDRV